ncbi:unnamed protein product [Trichobilharzia szidati]|nr:unnamed protein product [Trichobilharzia szidati]
MRLRRVQKKTQILLNLVAGRNLLSHQEKSVGDPVDFWYIFNLCATSMEVSFNVTWSSNCSDANSNTLFIVAGVTSFIVNTSVLPVLLLPIIFWTLASIFAIIATVQFCQYVIKCSMTLLMFILWFETILTCNTLALALIKLLEKTGINPTNSSPSANLNF